LGSLCYAIGGVYTRWLLKRTEYDSLTLMASMVLSAAALMLIATPIWGMDSFEPSPMVIISALVVGVLGTGIAYVWNANIIRSLGVTRATIANYLSPVFGVVVGMIFLKERLEWYEIVGASIVILS